MKTMMGELRLVVRRLKHEVQAEPEVEQSKPEATSGIRQLAVRKKKGARNY